MRYPIHADLDAHQLYHFYQGTSIASYQFMGAHPTKTGYRFIVWAPRVRAVSVIGSFNGWNETANPMKQTAEDIWMCEIEGVREYDEYMYCITTRSGRNIHKADPYAFHAQTRPGTASRCYDLDGYIWHDEEHLKSRAAWDPYHAPVSIYEVHLGSWKRDEEGRFYTYERLADELIPYAKEMGYTHLELMPVMEHPLDESWGYQVTGYYAATSRYGTPKGLMALIDRAHQAGLGVILDWVPAHFPKDGYGLYQFTGEPLYEYTDPQRAENRGWGTVMFDYGRGEVRSFMISNALFYLDVFHADGLRVDAVSYLLYRDYCRDEGDWTPNQNGGRENLESILLFQDLNRLVFRDFPYALLCAEEATSFPGVTHPVHENGLGFNYKWNMGWMHDVLDYFAMDPVYRPYHHHKLTFSLTYAFTENYILPLSHDEVVHGKKSLLNKMWGDIDQKFASLRCLYALQYAHPGKKLLMMGGEFAQFIEWKDDDGLDWLLMLYDRHPQMRTYVRALNEIYKQTPALFEIDDSFDGFVWLLADEAQRSVYAFLRRGFPREDGTRNSVLVILNLSGADWHEVAVPVPLSGKGECLLSTQNKEYGGWGEEVTPIQSRLAFGAGKPYEVIIPHLPACTARYYTWEEEAPEEKAETAEPVIFENLPKAFEIKKNSSERKS